MKKNLKKAVRAAAALCAACVMAINAAAASFTLGENNVNITAGETVEIPVYGADELKITPQCASVANAVYNSETGTITLKANDFGETVLLVYDPDDKSDRDYIYVKSAAPAAQGTFKTLGKYYQRFKLSDGTYAKGWYSIAGNTYYFYPNGIAELYTGPIMHKNKLYFVQNGVYTGEIFDAYIFEVLNNNLPVDDDCEVFYNTACERYGAENVTKEWADNGDIIITAQSYMPGFPWGSKGKYYFSKEGSVPSGDVPTELAGYTFSDKVTYSMGGYDDALFKSTLKSLYVRKALFEAFGKNCKAYKKSSGLVYYRWTGVGKEKANVDLVINSSSLDFTIYIPD
ncbi:MAG: hypothetical protein ACI4J5_01600 [Oscillospiraceae bacterium]